MALILPGTPDFENAPEIAPERPTKRSIAFDEETLKSVENLPDDLPTPLWWRVLVVKLDPPTKVGSIELPDQTREYEAQLMQVGKLVRVGESAFSAKGLGVGKAQAPTVYPKVGDFVVFARHAGSRIAWRDWTLVQLNDDEILMTGVDPRDFRAYL